MYGGYGGVSPVITPSTIAVSGINAPYANKYGGRMDQLAAWYGVGGYPNRKGVPLVVDRVPPIPLSLPPPPQVVPMPVPVVTPVVQTVAPQPVVTSVVPQPVVTSVVQQPLVTSVAQPVATGVPTSRVISSTVEPLPPMV